ncbi:MAG: YncE family protein [Candidatus Thermoplasmatota archaeon]|nr:YncE family protein [Candidatus Thermoplasmatota archaeon]
MFKKGKKIGNVITIVIAFAMVFSVLGVMPISGLGTSSSGHSSVTGSNVVSPAASGSGISVTFTETGLASGTFWSVQLGNLYSSSNSTNITFKVASGSYSYFVYYSGYSGYVFHGHVNVSNSPVSVSLTFYSLSFSNTGVSSGFSWLIRLSNETGYSNEYFGNNSTVVFYVANGNYSYTIRSAVYGRYDTIEVASGHKLISDNSQTVTLKFYQLSFTESGLPLSSYGYSWSLTITNGRDIFLNQQIHGSTFNLFVTKGNYTYQVYYDNYQETSLGFYSSAIKTGYLNTSISTSLSLVFHNVTFSQTGLPAGAEWGIGAWNNTTNLFVDMLVTKQSSGSLYFLSGNYGYISLVFSQNQITYQNDTHGYLSVGSSATNVKTVDFRGIYNVTFSESGLPHGMRWSIQNMYISETGRTYSFESDTSTISVYISNGSYSYYLSNPTFGRLQTESFNVSGKSQIVSLSFYKLAFVENGLPTGSAWQVFIHNSSLSLFSYAYNPVPNELVFYVTNITFIYSFNTVLQDSPFSNPFINKTLPGVVSISDTGVTVNVYFTLAPNLFKITFVETGLSTSTLWFASIYYPGYSSQFSRGNSITFVAVNGTYNYSVDGTITGSLKVSGSNVTITTYLGWTKYVTMEFKESGLASNTKWGVTVGNVSHTTSSSEIYFTLYRGSYVFNISPPAGYISYPSGGELNLYSNSVFAITFQPTESEKIGYVTKTVDLSTGRVSPGDYYSFSQYGGAAGYMTYDSQNEMVYMSDSYSVLLINATNSVISLYINSGLNAPRGIAYDNNNRFVYVANSGDNSIAVINTTSNRVTYQISVGANSRPYDVLYNTYNKLLYAYDEGTGNLSVINTTSNSIVKNITLGDIFGNIGIYAPIMTYSSANGNVFVADQNTGNITEINGTTNAILKNVTYPFKGTLTGVLYVPSTNSLYISGLDVSNITVLNAVNLSYERNITIQKSYVTDFIYDPANEFVYVSAINVSNNQLNSQVYIINAKNNTYIASISVGVLPYSMVLVSRSNTVFTYNIISNSITEISQLSTSKPTSSFSPIIVYGIVGAVIAVGAGLGAYLYVRRKH